MVTLHFNGLELKPFYPLLSPSEASCLHVASSGGKSASQGAQMVPSSINQSNG